MVATWRSKGFRRKLYENYFKQLLDSLYNYWRQNWIRKMAFLENLIVKKLHASTPKLSESM